MSDSAERLVRYRVGALRAQIEFFARYRLVVDAAIEERKRGWMKIGEDQMAEQSKASFGDIIGIGFRIISNRQKIMELWDEIAPVIRNVTTMYPKIKTLMGEIAPELIASPLAPARVAKPFAPPDGFSVEWLQESLNKLQNAGLTVDGDYGEMTRAAVRKYQEARGLAADGWAGADTSAAIFADMAKIK